MLIRNDHAKLYAQRFNDFWAIHSIVVEKEFRGKGFGTSAMTEFLTRVDMPVVLYATAELGTRLDRVVKFYRKFGFEKITKSIAGELGMKFPQKYNMVLTSRGLRHWKVLNT